MKFTLNKMSSDNREVVEYTFAHATDRISVNQFLGKKLSLSWTGNIFCRKCAKKTKKSFGEGFCYPCFTSAPEASPCIIHPELCEAHLGKGRDVEFEQKHHNQPHFIYLAATEIVKVGVTRTTQIPTRWIDQGARKALVIAETPNRYLAGIMEVALKDVFSDKTNWQNMLRDITDDTIDLIEEKWKIEELLPSDLSQYINESDEIYEFNYPVLSYPEKISSLGFEKSSEISGILTGIRGQYLMFDYNNVINIRKHTGFEIELNA